MAKKVARTRGRFWKKKREITIPKLGTFGQDFLIYSIILLFVMLVLGKFPIIDNMHIFIRWLLIPFGGAWVLDRNLVDGKSPIGFLKSSFSYTASVLKGRKIIKYKTYKKLDNYSVDGKLTVREVNEYEGG